MSIGINCKTHNTTYEANRMCVHAFWALFTNNDHARVAIIKIYFSSLQKSTAYHSALQWFDYIIMDMYRFGLLWLPHAVNHSSGSGEMCPTQMYNNRASKLSSIVVTDCTKCGSAL